HGHPRRRSRGRAGRGGRLCAGRRRGDAGEQPLPRLAAQPALSLHATAKSLPHISTWLALPCRGRHAAARGLTCQPGRRCATRHHLTATARQCEPGGDMGQALVYKGGMKAIDTLTPCPCGNPAGYGACCGPLHDGNVVAASAAQLMRSRYSAYVLKREDYLLASWHADTRPASLRLAAQQPAPTW